MFGTKDIEARFQRIDVALAEMGGVVESQLADVLTAVERRDVALADRVAARDRETDARERQVDDEVTALLEARRLSPRDLRRALTALKIAAEMERVGDLSKNVAHRLATIVRDDPEGRSRAAAAPVLRMGGVALSQLSAALDALFRADSRAARAVRDGDDQVDDLYNSVFSEVLRAMAEDTRMAGVGMHLVFAAKNLERVGDHATNIAERVHFAVTGEEIAGERVKTDETSELGFAAERAIG